MESEKRLIGWLINQQGKNMPTIVENGLTQYEKRYFRSKCEKCNLWLGSKTLDENNLKPRNNLIGKYGRKRVVLLQGKRLKKGENGLLRRPKKTCLRRNKCIPK